MLDFQLENSTDAIVVCGTTGESSTLDDEEKMTLIRHCNKKVNKKIPVIAGTGSNNTVHAVELSKKAADLGVDALLCVTPYYNKTTQQGLFEHYKKLAESVDIPIIVYNVPSRTGLNILPETYGKLTEIPNIRAIKEANGDVASLSQTILKTNKKLDIYSGDDGLILPMLSLGAKGVISVLSNICPKETHDICSLFFEGENERAKELQLKYSELIGALFCQTNPIPVKYAQSLLGHCLLNTRLPLVPPCDSARIRIEDALKGLNLI